MSRSFDQLWMKRAKSLTQALIISGTMNIGLLGTFIYFVLKDRNAAISFELPEAGKETIAHETNEEVLRAFSSLSYGELMALLDNRDLVEDGFSKRDLALACLASFHHFNIDQALGGGAPQKRRVFFRNKDATQALDVVAYPGLSEDQFDGILSYAKTEKWPLTSKGLFFEVKRSGREVDLSLLEAFYATPEFFSVHTFFQKVGLLVDKNVIVSLLTEGDWEMIDKFCEQQRLLQDFSEEKRVAFLMNYFDHYHSTLSAFLLTLHDQEFVMRRLDDNTLLQFMNLIVDKKDPLQNMAKSILVSPRSDLVRRAAASLLYASQNETMPEPYDYLATVERFCPESIKRSSLEGQKTLTQAKPALQAVASQVSIDKKMKQSSYRMHTIESGDSLWKISRKYKVSIEELKKLNHLESEKLKVGRQLQIPNT